MAFLDETGVQYLWNKIKSTFTKNEDAVHKTGEETITGTKTFDTGMLGKAITIEPVEGVFEILPKNGIVYQIPAFLADTSNISINFHPFEEAPSDDSAPYPNGAACVTLVFALFSPVNIIWSSDSSMILWEDGTPPDLEGVCVLTFITYDGGNSWVGCVNAINVSPENESY